LIQKGNVDDKASLLSAFKGAYAVFAVTNYWEKMDMELEIHQGKQIADAALVCPRPPPNLPKKCLQVLGVRRAALHLVYTNECHRT
jgi:hypothetical protein